METLYAKLYDKYEKLKKKRFSELDEINKEQEEKFLNYVHAAEELIQHLKNENEKLHAEVNDLRNEVASVRTTKDEQCAEYQRLLLEENQKSKVLSEEVRKLHELHEELAKGDKNRGTTPHSAKYVSDSSSRRRTRKRSRLSDAEVEDCVVTPACSNEKIIVRESAKDLANENMPQEVVSCYKQVQCCIGSSVADGNGAATCLFQALIECLVGMKISAANQTEGLCISALHQSSGYAFSLTWMNNGAGEDSELLYRVSSLGTFERVAPEWMRDVLMFSMNMCPVFFQRVSRVIKLHC